MSVPYRIGTTSFVHPASWLENARRLAGRVRDVEVLLFQPPSDAAGPSPGEIAALARLGEERGLGYTVHAPLVPLAAEDEGRRRAAAAAVRRAIELTAPLRPAAVTVHLELRDAPGRPAPAELSAWRERAARSLREVLACGVAPRTIAVETLEYDFALAEPLVEALGLSVALDVGHLARDGVALLPVVERHLARAPVVHWHGTEPGGRDHRSLRHFPRADGVALVRALVRAGWSGVVTLEVFGEAELGDSLAVLASLEAEALA